MFNQSIIIDNIKTLIDKSNKRIIFQLFNMLYFIFINIYYFFVNLR